MSNLLEQSAEIVNQAIADIQPYATIAMISGGNDSMAAYQVAKRLGVQIDFIMHGRTGTGIPATTEFVRAFAASEGVAYIEADAGPAYEQYVLRKGFFGRGVQAHTFAYHELKHKPFRKAISANIRQGKKGRPVVLLNGARVAESANRAKNLNEPVRVDDTKTNYWVNVIHHWDKQQRDEFLADCGAPCNPVTREMCRSGECLCGTMQDKGVRAEAIALYPDWGRWLTNLENEVYARGFTWGWGDDVPKSFTAEKAGQMVFSDFAPMCHSCKAVEPAHT